MQEIFPPVLLFPLFSEEADEPGQISCPEAVPYQAIRIAVAAIDEIGEL